MHRHCPRSVTKTSSTDLLAIAGPSRTRTPLCQTQEACLECRSAPRSRQGSPKSVSSLGRLASVSARGRQLSVSAATHKAADRWPMPAITHTNRFVTVIAYLTH